MFFRHRSHQNQKKSLRRIYVLAATIPLLVVLIPLVYLSLKFAAQSEAAWFDDTYRYRSPISFTHNAALSNRRVSITVATDALVTAGKLQSDCDDTRFTDINGKVLRYQLVSGCNTSTTQYDVVFPTIINGANVSYMYYGNSTVASGSQDVSGVTSLSPSGGSPSAGTEEKGTSPVLYLGLDEGYGTTTQDGTSGNNDGTLSNTPTWKSPDFCISGNCILFDGSDDIVTVTNANPIDLDASGGLSAGFTMEAWVRPNGAGEGTGGQIIFKGTNTWLKVASLSSGKLDLMASLDLATTDATLTASGKVLDGQWNHVAISYTDDADDELTLWVNGVSVGSSTNGVGSLAADVNNLVIGGTTTNNFKGTIDQFKIYNTERTSSQMASDALKSGGNDTVATQLGGTANTSISNGLVGFWPMDESAANTCSGGTNDSCDKSGNGFDGAWANNTAAITGKYGYGTDYDGTDDSTAVSDNDAFSVNTTNSFTVSAWVNPDTNSGTVNIISKGNTSNFEWSLGASTTQAQAILWDSGGSVIAQANISTLFSTGSWQLYTFTADLNSNTLTIYRNGVLGGTATIAGTYTNGTANLRFGERADGSNDYDGKIDDVRIYNRALSSGEVMRLYTTAPGPSGYWKFDEKTGTTSTFDSSGSGFTGTMNSITQSSWTNGKFGSALNFVKASTQDVNLGVTTTLFPNSNSWSYGFWFKYTPVVAPTADGFLVSLRTSTNRANAFFIRDSGDSLSFTYRSGGSNTFITLATTASIGNNWHHVMATYDGTTYLIYVDGVLTATSTAAQDVFGTGTVRVGSDSGSNNSDAVIDDLRDYNYPRSASQVIEDMNGSRPINGGSSSSSSIYWELDEQNGNTINNSGSNGSTYNGTNSGAAWLTNASCKINGCLNFDTTTDTVSAGDPVFIDGLTGFSTSFWLNPQTLATNKMILSKANNVTQRVFQIKTDDATSTELKVMIASSASDTSNYCITSGLGLTALTWQQIHVVYDGTQAAASRVTVYKNGKPITCTVTGTIPTAFTSSTTSNLKLGQGDDTTPTALITYIDELKIFPFALTQDQVLLDQNNGSLNFGTGSNEATQLTGGAGNAPVAYWKMDEKTGTTIVDSSGNGNTSSAFTGNTTWTSGKVGAALLFDGTDDVARIVESTGTDIGGTSDSYTLEAWFRTNTTYGATAAIVEKNTNAAGSGTYPYSLNMGIAGNVCFSLGDVGHQIATCSSGSIPLNDDRWHYAVGIRDVTTDTIYLYIDGILKTSGPDSTTATMVNNDDISIGNGGPSYVAKDWNGRVDDVKIFNYARNASQIAYDYNRGGPVGWWQFDECSGSTANDNSGYGNTGTLTIGATGTYTAPGTCVSGTSTHAWYGGATGKWNSALGFDGTDDYVEVANSASLQVGSFTISAWINTSATGEQSIIDKRGPDNFGGYQLRVDGTFPLDIAVSVKDSQVIADTLCVATAAVPSGIWTHIVGTYAYNTGTLLIYMNGKLVQTCTGITRNPADTPNTDPLRIGDVSRNIAVPSSFNFAGLIDDAQVFGYPLSLTQIQKLYNQNASVRFGPSTGSP
ncbi:MAG: LamG-like jellyroll fold domain-containing protein [Candidatus Woesebacteria bacterium]